MKYFKRKNGSVFGKEEPNESQLESYKKAGHILCAETGKNLKPTPKIKRVKNAKG